jgi:hypothetical protein
MSTQFNQPTTPSTVAGATATYQFDQKWVPIRVLMMDYPSSIERQTKKKKSGSKQPINSVGCCKVGLECIAQQQAHRGVRNGAEARARGARSHDSCALSLNTTKQTSSRDRRHTHKLCSSSSASCCAPTLTPPTVYSLYGVGVGFASLLIG